MKNCFIFKEQNLCQFFIILIKILFTGKSYASQKLMGGWHMGGARIVSDYVEIIEQDKPDAEWERLARMTKSRCHFSALVI